jgi:hypothetical protein
VKLFFLAGPSADAFYLEVGKLRGRGSVRIYVSIFTCFGAAGVLLFPACYAAELARFFFSMLSLCLSFRLTFLYISCDSLALFPIKLFSLNLRFISGLNNGSVCLGVTLLLLGASENLNLTVCFNFLC